MPCYGWSLVEKSEDLERALKFPEVKLLPWGGTVVNITLLIYKAVCDRTPFNVREKPITYIIYVYT